MDLLVQNNKYGTFSITMELQVHNNNNNNNNNNNDDDNNNNKKKSHGRIIKDLCGDRGFRQLIEATRAYKS